MWYIGQDVVCVKTHEEGIVKEGQVYSIKALRKGCCYIQIHVGVNLPLQYLSECSNCKSMVKSDGNWWLSEIRFKTLDELSDITELLEVLNKENHQEV